MPLYLFCKQLSIYKKDSYLMILNIELTCVSAEVRCSFVSCVHTSISILPVLQHNTIYMPCTLREDFKQLSFNCVHIPDWSISFSSCIKCSYSCTVISRASPRTQLVSQAFLVNIYTPGMHPHLINHAYVFISLKVNSGTSSLLLCQLTKQLFNPVHLNLVESAFVQLLTQAIVTLYIEQATFVYSADDYSLYYNVHANQYFKRFNIPTTVDKRPFVQLYGHMIG